MPVFSFTLAAESRFKAPFYLSVRKRSNLTDRTSYFRFCSSLQVIEVDQMPVSPENGFGESMPNCKLTVTCRQSPGERSEAGAEG